jgi:midasin (ATPase involved in ribosome maturation)
MANADRLPLLSQGATGYGTTRFGKYLAAGAGRKLDTVTCHEGKGLRLLLVMG